MTSVSTCFVHGINQTREERANAQKRFDASLRQFGVRDAFQYVDAATWRSSGRFDQDIDIMYRVTGLREDAIEDIAEKFRQLNGYQHPIVLVGHSMGQPLAYLAAQRVDWKVPWSFLSLGGPLGNVNPVVQSYMSWAHKGPLTGCREWVDVWNPEDPVCTNLMAPSVVLGHLPVPSEVLAVVLDGIHKTAWSVEPYRAYGNAQSRKFDFGARMQPGDPPFKEHSSYFEDQFCFDILRKMRDNLAKES